MAAQRHEGGNMAEEQPQSKKTVVPVNPSDHPGVPVEVLRETKYGPVLQTDTIRDEMCELAILNLIHVICD